MTATHPRFRPALPARFRVALLVSLAAVVAFCVVLLPMRSYAGPTPEALQAVHTDALHTTYDGSVLRLSTRIGLGEYREADPANLIFNLEDKASARVELPDLPAFAFLGKPGDPVWIAPESQDPDLIWPGWDTETITPGVLAGDAVDLTLLSSNGPGNVEVFFNYDDFTGQAQRLFSAADPSRRILHQPIGRHVHANWAFTALGTYHLTFQATATTTTGTPLASTPTTYTFVVGPYVPPTSPTGTPPGTPPTTPPTNPTPSSTPTHPPAPPTATPTGPAHPTSTLTTPGRNTPVPSSPTTPAPTSNRTTSPPTPPRTTTNSLASPSRTFSGGDEEHATSDSPPDSNNTGTPPGNLPPCITTSNPATTNPTTPGTGSTTSPGQTGSPASPSPTNSSATTPADPAKTTLDNGHADYAVRVENGTLKSRVKDGTKPGAPIWRDPSAVTIKLTAASATHAPGGAFAFLGPTGSPLWQIPQTQKDGVIWLGWNTEELTKSQLSTAVDWRLTRVTGPGTLAVFEFDSFGRPKIIFNSRDGLPDTYKIPLGTHAHGNWSFTKPGTYQATFTHTATLTTGKPSTTTSTLTFVVPSTSSNASNGTHPAAFHNASAGGPDRHHTPTQPAAWLHRSAEASDGPQTQVGGWRSTGPSGAVASGPVASGPVASGMATIGGRQPVQPASEMLATASPSQGTLALAAGPLARGGVARPAGAPARASAVVAAGAAAQATAVVAAGAAAQATAVVAAGAAAQATAVVAAGAAAQATAVVAAGAAARASAVVAAGAPAGASAVVVAAPVPRAGAADCKLASTGAEIGPAWIGAGATLLVIGAVTVVATRRRRDDA